MADTNPSEGKKFALQFISGKYQGGVFPLKPEREIIIGRSSDMDMVLVEDMVSRKHAKISTHEGKIIIQDLGSTNGTFVNGEKIKRTRLKEGDRILIGTSILKLVALEEGQERSDAEVKNMLQQVAAKRDRSSSPMSGRLDEIPLPDLLQLFSTSKKSGVLVITSQGHEGRIYMRAGRIYYASIDQRHEVGPQKAFCRIMTWKQGFFELGSASEEKFMVELDESTEALLMEAMRQIDELERIKPQLPPPTTRFALAKPLSAPLRDLEPDQLDVLQAVHNSGRVDAVLDESVLSDLDTYNALLHLIRNGYLREVK
jgi:pSer/pThr/pTyr-binding forkhead associated (FHA) protein